MQNRRFQHKAATGSLTLPVAALFTACVWLVPGPSDPFRWAGLLCVALTAYVMVELNNAHSLIRIRSRLISSTFLVLTGSCVFLQADVLRLLPPLFLAAAYYALFHAYQRARPEHAVFSAFACIGIGSLFFPQLLFIVPTFYAAMLFQLHAFSLRTLLAGLLGLVMPFWIRGAADFYLERPDALLPFFYELVRVGPPDYSGIDTHRWAALGVIVCPLVVSILHFLHTYYNDKIRVRMYYYALLCQVVFILAALFALPQHFDVLTSLLIVAASPLLAHYFALTENRVTNGFFILWLIIICYLTLGNLWTPLWIF